MRNGMAALRYAVPQDIQQFPSHAAVKHLEAVDWDWRAQLGIRQANGWFYVFEPDGVMIALIGGYPAGDGIATLVVCAVPGIEHHALSFVKACRSAIDYERQRNHIHTIQAEIEAADDAALRFARAFGMQRERFLPAHGPDGSDYVLMTRRWPE